MKSQNGPAKAAAVLYNGQVHISIERVLTGIQPPSPSVSRNGSSVFAAEPENGLR